ncbi:hypothetical protein LTR62_007076 [Meristemomyces frigidus]|uniref:Aminoglycoside phosphotransferase domain-containing protein n=1 Tax=Meristemomyces frigidus TaxID=1508187 RepID=A0AAN7TF27_9PEZI|nr:hypothetical protein LTR62_007076 [Meristemomyces frigidus]
MVYLRSKGIPIPKVYGYSATADNPTETEYIFMEFTPGKELGAVWSNMDGHDRLRFVRSLVDLETRLLSTTLPASGSLYFHRDMTEVARKLGVDPENADRPESLYIGPSTSPDLWYGRRSTLDAERGPYIEADTVLSAGAKKETLYLERFNRPLLPFDRMRRETFNLEKQLPSVHLDSLQKYLKVSTHLLPQGDPRLLRPTIGHPDLRLSNIFVSNDFEITSLIDWQYSTILRLFLQPGIPNDLDNSMDPISSAIEPPSLSPELDEMSEEERLQQLEIFAKRQLHHFYMTETADKNPLHFDAVTYPFSIGRRKIFQLSSAPWEGDNIPLRSSLIFVKQNWPTICGSSADPCPITFTDEEERECLRLDDLEQNAVEQLEASKAMLGLGPEGWISNENYEAAQAAIAQMKVMCLEQAETDSGRRAIREHWVYDDMDEEEYL